MAELTEREVAALTAAAIGLTRPAAARRLEIGERTLFRVWVRAAAKLGATCTMHAVALAVARGLISAEHIERRTLPETGLPETAQEAS